ncbi:MAG: hypothetical protein M0R74_10610 [Dehalococcoidia bacterium]|nr:hypothetical protein [Dehalococcoidia bacterium]
MRFGQGRILMLTFKDEDGSGVVLRDSGAAHAVGEDANMPPEKGVKPKPGEIYLHFTNVESAQALRLTLDEAIAEMSNVARVSSGATADRLRSDDAQSAQPALLDGAAPDGNAGPRPRHTGRAQRPASITAETSAAQGVKHGPT